MANEETVVEPEEKVEEEVSPTDGREEIIEGIAEDVKANAGEEPVAAGSEETADVDIPDDFTAVAEKAGFTKEEIVDFASGRTNEELTELIPGIEDALSEDEEDDPEVTEPDAADEVAKVSPEDAADVSSLVAAKVKEEMAPVLKMLEDQKKVDKDKSDEELGRRTHELLDKAAEEFPVFGKFDELPRFPSGKLKGQLVPNSSELKARSAVYDDVAVFLQAGRSIEDAMSKALAAYKGEHLETEIKRGMIRDLHKHSQRLSGARTAKVTKKVFTDDREEILDGIRQDLKAAGMD